MILAELDGSKSVLEPRSNSPSSFPGEGGLSAPGRWEIKGGYPPPPDPHPHPHHRYLRSGFVHVYGRRGRRGLKGFRYGYLEYFSQKKKKCQLQPALATERESEEIWGTVRRPGGRPRVCRLAGPRSEKRCGSGPRLQVSTESSKEKPASWPQDLCRRWSTCLGQRVSDSNLLQAGEVTRPVAARGEDGSPTRGCR